MTEQVLTLGVSSAAPEGFAQLLVEHRGVEFIEGTVKFEAKESLARKLLLQFSQNFDLFSPEEVTFSYIKNGITRCRKTFTAVEGVQMIAPKSEQEVADEELKAKKTVKEFKAFFDEVGIAYKKNAGEPKCIELFNENKESIDSAKLAEFLGE